MNPSRAYDELDTLERLARGGSLIHRLDARTKILVTGAYLLCLLSVPVHDLPVLLGMAVFPVFWTVWSGINASFLLKRACLTLPFAVLIGIFNPLFDTSPAMRLGAWTVTGGWISFASIVLRAVLAAWAALLLLTTTGFFSLCRGLRQMKVPAVFTTQLLFVFRYIFVIAEEAMRMLRARALRNPQRRRETLGHWSSLVGTLLLRSFERAERLHQALLSRGFTGEFRIRGREWFAWRDALFLLLVLGLLLVLRFGHPAERIGRAFETFAS